MFSPSITAFWQTPFDNGEIIQGADGLSITINPELAHDRRVTVLDDLDGRVRVALTPALAERIGLRAETTWSAESFREALAGAGITLHDADFIFYFDRDAKDRLLGEADADGVRMLGERDADAFAAFEAANTEQDLDDAYVELDHWAVIGAHQDGKLVSATSAYPWGESLLADLGVLTLPAARGKGHARNVVRAIARHVYSRGYEPQYRCQLDNETSRALADKAGLSLFGTWEVVSAETED
ncbi:GNAT family N-acetyltransferase [Paeniglutamicibacter cryotolerans]|uniref:RimJ/RimL family protein N-acetyltransferase n=1 Tax=Paeniglutamicibacter cryotolerans TaxID=670079 RepID=A0A839QME1_9MICC|nr:GNAT family N-acetyltransferase [Paeniglutamicibacter cryotolerans]MBB2997047.1 RimJ/RimL family protein N-acetyltransferase [Paeniglutamicibacter cryotolerans]